jgi:hypothetical protein
VSGHCHLCGEFSLSLSSVPWQKSVHIACGEFAPEWTRDLCEGCKGFAARRSEYLTSVAPYILKV